MPRRLPLRGSHPHPCLMGSRRQGPPPSRGRGKRSDEGTAVVNGAMNGHQEGYATHTDGRRVYDLASIRRDFPILKREVNGKPLVYLDNAATSQKPVQVIAELTRYYRDYNSNVHRGVHTLSQEATEAYEAVRTKIARFIGADDPREI